MRLEGLGPHRRLVSSASAEGQRWFDQGLALAYAFNAGESLRSFRKAAEIDPACAMHFWGIAYAAGPDINTPKVLKEGSLEAWQAVRTARRFAGAATPVERALIEAMAARWAESPPDDRAPLDRAWAEAMKGVAAAHPSDSDVAALLAEALMQLRPWLLWSLAGAPAAGTDELLRSLQAALEADPRHPLANHLLIHALEASPHPERADAAAAILRDLMPGAPHLVHMPSHIDARMGRWALAIDANQRAIQADRRYREAQPGAEPGAGYPPHNHHMLAYAAMMVGRSALALQAARDAVGRLPAAAAGKASSPFHQLYLTMPLEVLVRFGRWDEILALPAPPDEAPFVEALRHMARGIALAAREDVAGGAAEERLFRAARSRLPADWKIGETKGGAILDVADHLLRGELLYRGGRVEQGLAELRAATAAEDELGYKEPPLWIQPTRHALGAALLQAGRTAEAEVVFREDLKRLPGNGWGLFGLGRALRLQPKAAEAEEVEAKFKAAWKDADVQIKSACACLSGV